jgi:hypothetical protein
MNSVQAIDYSDPNIPEIQEIKLTSSFYGNSLHLKSRLTVKEYSNRLRSVLLTFRTPWLDPLQGRNLLAPPCNETFQNSAGDNSLWFKKLILVESKSIGDVNYRTYESELVDSTADYRKLPWCQGTYFFSGVTLIDERGERSGATSIGPVCILKLLSCYIGGQPNPRNYSDSSLYQTGTDNAAIRENPQYSKCPKLKSESSDNFFEACKQNLIYSDLNFTIDIDKILLGDKIKQDAEAKAAAELKAQQELEAKAAAELKARQDAEKAELKATQEAEVKALQESEAKVAAEQKAKQEADAKALLAQLAAVLKAKQQKISSSAKKTTITCVKGKLIKKVTAIKPVCPKGYKKK